MFRITEKYSIYISKQPFSNDYRTQIHHYFYSFWNSFSTFFFFWSSLFFSSTLYDSFIFFLMFNFLRYLTLVRLSLSYHIYTIYRKTFHIFVHLSRIENKLIPSTPMSTMKVVLWIFAIILFENNNGDAIRWGKNSTSNNLSNIFHNCPQKTYTTFK